MGFRENEKGVSPLLGFILMLMILMISISALQTQYVPDVCKNMEADHIKQLTGQLTELKSISSTKNVKMDMGVDYPEYLFLITPKSTATSLRVKEFNVSVSYTEVLANGSKVKREDNFTSSRIEVSPNYLFYPQDQLILENTAVFKLAEGGNYITMSDQSSFKKDIQFTLMNATFSSLSTTQSLGIISVPQSTGGRVLAENLSISFDSVHPHYWETMEDYNVTVNGDRVTIKEEDKVAFSLEEVMLYTGNERSADSKPSRMLKTNSMDTFDLKKGESVKLGARVVDKYNNPVEGVNVNVSVSSSIGDVNPSVLYTDSDGEVYTTFSAQNSGAGTVIFNCSAIKEELSYEVSVTTIAGGNTSLSISLSSEPEAGADGHSSKTIKAYVSSEGEPLPGFSVTFAANSTDANLSSTEAKTNYSGYASTEVSQDVEGKNCYRIYGYAGSAIDSMNVLLNTSSGAVSGVPSIDMFNVEEVISPNPHYEFNVDWEVSDDDGDLSSVELRLEDLEDGSIDIETESISGSSASGTTDLVDQHESGVHDYNVTITVIDGEGNSVSETKTVTGGDGV